MEIQPGQITADVGSIPLGRVDAFGVDWAWDKSGFDGWGATDSTRETEQNVRGHGGWSGDGFLTPRIMALRGRAYAPTPAAASDALDRLNDQASIDDFTFRVYEPGKTRYVVAHRTRAVQVAWQMPNELVWGLNLTADDSRKFYDTLTGTTKLPSTTGGLTVPFTVPYTIPSTQVSGQVSLRNQGNIEGPVRLRVDGPTVGPVIRHESSGRTLVFSSTLVLGVGEWLEIDMDEIGRAHV